ncbi:MAG: AI-2E family transporter [Clostridia bacterium]|nr:AI-2E family transporter [Clostridia bacterium]
MQFIKQHKKAFLIGTVLYALTFFLIVWSANLDRINLWLGSVFVVFRPVIIGLALAYLCNPFFRFYERRMLAGIKSHPLRRTVALTLTYLTLFSIVAVLLLLILPQLIDSVRGFLENLDSYLANAVDEWNQAAHWLNARLPKNDLGEGLIPMLQRGNTESITESILKFFRLEELQILDLLSPGMIGSIFDVASNLFLIAADVLFGLFISLYLLASKEKRYAQIMRARRAFLSDGVNAALTKICTTADRSFGSFFKGKLIDSAIIGVLTYIIISIFNVPYAILIAAIVAITDIIPVVGPFIGVLPASVIIVLTDPPKIIPFILAILVIQQIDGNIIAPKILGEHTGVSSLCVIVAITVMGSLWGFVGMLLGVPIFATVLELGSAYLDNRLRKKGLPVETRYYSSEHPDELAGSDAPAQQEAAHPTSRRHGMAKESLSPEEKQQLRAYALAHRSQLFSEDADAVLEQYAPTEHEKNSTDANA